MAVFKATKNKSTTGGVFKATEKRSYDSTIVGGWESENKDSLNTLKKYQAKVTRGDYLSEEDIAGYRSALDSYVKSANNLRNISKQFGGNSTDDAQWNSQLSSLENQFKGVSNYYSQWKDEGSYRSALASQKEYEAKTKYDLTGGSKEIEDLEAQKAALTKQFEDADIVVGTEEGNRANNEYLRKIEELDQQISSKKQYHSQAQRIQEGIKLAGVADQESEYYDPEFKQYSGYSSTAVDGAWDKLWSQYGMGYSDLTYEYINNQNGMRDDILRKGASFAGEQFDYDEFMIYDKMDANEISIYNYYYAKDGKEAAEKYLSSIRETLNSREASERFGKLQDHTFAELLFGIEAGVDQFQTGLESLGNAITGKDDYIPQTSTQMVSGMVREDLADDSIPLWYNIKTGKWENKVFGNSLGQIGYDAVTTTTNMLPSILTSTVIGAINPAAGSIAGAALLGASASGNAYQEMLNLGYDKGQARTYAALVGGSEAGLQYLLGGIGTLGGKLSGNAISKVLSGVDNAFARTAIKLGGNMLSEGFEEGLQEILTPWLKNLATGVYSEEVNWSEVAYSGLLGALTAGVLEGGSTISGEVNTYKTGKVLQAADISAQRLAEIGSTFAADTVAYQLAGRVDENTGAYTLGRLFNEIGAELTEANKADIARELENRGVSAKDAEVMVDAMAGVVVGEYFTDKQIAMLEANDVLTQAYIDVIINPNSTVNQRSKGYNEVLSDLAKQKTSNQVSSNATQTEPVSQNEGNVSAESAVPTETETPSQSDYEATVEGKTIRKSTGEAVSIKEVASVGNGKMTLRLEDGSEVDSKEIAYSNAGEAYVFETVANLGVDAVEATRIINAFRNSGVEGKAFADGMKLAFEYGYGNFSQQELAQRDFAGNIPRMYINTAYEIGQKMRQQESEQNSTTQKPSEKHTAKKREVYYTTKDGKVLSMSQAEKNGKLALKDKQSVAVKTAKFLQKLGLGGNYYFFESYVDEKGNRVFKDRFGNIQSAPNGLYYSDGDIYIDINAGTDSHSITLRTLSHELTHMIQQWSAAKYKVMADFLAEQYDKEGRNAYEAAKAKQAELSALRGKFVPFQEAYHEFVADSMSTLFDDGNLYDILTGLKAKDKTVFDYIKKFFDNLAAKVRKLYANAQAETDEGQFIQGLSKDTIYRLQQMFADALVEASENYAASEQKNTDTQIGVQYSAKAQESQANKVITSTMSDAERSTILRGKQLVAPIYEGQADAVIKEEKPNLESGQDKLIKAALVRIGEEFEVFTDYDIEDVDVKITLSRGNLRESVSKKANPTQIAKLLPVLKNAVEKSVGVESHKNRYFYDNTTISFDNLIGGYVDGEYFVPVRFGLKHIRGGEVTLYVVIDQQKIKAEVLKPITQTSGSTGSRSAYNINIAQIVPFVNSKDLLRYLPDDMLTSDQKTTKWEGIAETIIYTNNKNDEKYRKFIDAGNMQAAKMMVDAAAKANGYTIKAYHGTTNRQEKSTWNPTTRTWDTEYRRITVFKKQYPEQVGHFFNSDMDNAGGYGFELYPVYLMLKKPLVIDCKGQNYASITHDGMEMDTYEWAAYAKKQRYDGVIFENISDGVGYDDLSRLTTDYVVFDSNKIKSAETVVYDNNDNAIPISQRFNPRSNDIRYQDRAAAPSNRELLAQALEGVATDVEDFHAVKEYRRIAPLLDAEEEKLSLLNAQIREMSFGKGKRDNDKLFALRLEAKQTQNRIDIYDKQLLKLEATAPLQRVLEREKAKAYKRAEQKGKEAIQKEKERAQAKYDELAAKNTASRKKAVEGRRKTEMRHKIQKVVKKLNDLLLNETKDHHIPSALKKPVAEALDAIDVAMSNPADQIAAINEQIAKATTPEQAAELGAKKAKLEERAERFADKVNALKAAYDAIKQSPDMSASNSYDEVISSKIQEVSELIGETPMYDMSLSQLEAVYDMYRMIAKAVSNGNKAFKMARAESISQLGMAVGSEVTAAGGSHTHSVKALNGIKKFDWNNLKPVYAFERIGSQTFTELFNNVRAGEDVWAVDVTEARDFYLAQSKKYGYDQWDMEKKHTFESTTGKSFQLTFEQIMSLYAYSKRDQADDHLRMGGFVFDSAIEVVEKKHGIPVKYTVNTATAYNLSPEILADIVGTLTKEQAEFVDVMQDYLSTVMGAKGNEVSMALYDVKLFKEKHYFPLKSAKQYMYEQNEVAGEIRLKNSGFSKKTQPHASNPVILSNFMDVWAKHINDMSMYHAFVLPLEDFNRVYNYKSSTEENTDTESVKGRIQNAYGAQANEYISQLIKDLNGGAVTDPREAPAKNLMGKFKKAAVFASLSVVIQQPSAIGRALACIDLHHFIGPRVDHKRHKHLWEELKKYAPVAIIKEMGYFDTNMGRSTQDFIKAKEYTTIGQKAKALVADGNYRDEALSRLPALADELTWCNIWEAVKREMKSKHPEMDVTSEAFMEAAGKRFTEVITRTQVYDSVLARSGNMRAKGLFMNMWTAFMAEPTTSINMIEDALVKAGRGDKRYAGRAIRAVLTSVLLNSALVSVVYAMRDDDEDETYLEKYLASFTNEMLDGLNPATYYPFLKDVWSALQGFDIERSDMSLITNLTDTLQKLVRAYASENGDKKGAWWSLTDDITSLLGVPFKNIRRDVNGAYNLVSTLAKDAGGRSITWRSLLDSLQEAAANTIPVWGWLPGESRGDKLYDAIVNGDTDYVERLKNAYKSESAYTSAIRKALRENDPRVKKAAQAMLNGNAAERVRIVKEIIAEGHFETKDIQAAINAEVDKLRKQAE